jgi:hypothetical protein
MINRKKKNPICLRDMGFGRLIACSGHGGEDNAAIGKLLFDFL